MTGEEKRARQTVATQRWRARARGQAPALPEKPSAAARKLAKTEYNRAYYAAHKERLREGKAEYLKAYYRANRERARMLAAAKHAADPGPARARARAWYRENADRVKAVAKARRDADIEAHRAYRRALWQADPAKSAAQAAATQNRRRALKLKVGGKMTAADIRALKAASDGICAYCLQPSDRMHVEHCTPLCRGGTNTPDNCVMACGSCNSRKGTKTVLEFMCNLPRLGASVPE